MLPSKMCPEFGMACGTMRSENGNEEESKGSVRMEENEGWYRGYRESVKGGVWKGTVEWGEDLESVKRILRVFRG